MKKKDPCVIYWDSSSILSALFKDSNSETAIEFAGREGVHLISTLAYAEVCAVIHRIKRERLLTDILISAAFEALEKGPWRHLNVWPEWKQTKRLSNKWPLRGADLWHLATAKTLQNQTPELIVFTFDGKLLAAAEGENFIS